MRRKVLILSTVRFWLIKEELIIYLGVSCMRLIFKRKGLYQLTIYISMLELGYCCLYYVVVVKEKTKRCTADFKMLHFCRIVLTRNKNNNRHIFKSTSAVGTVTVQLFETRAIWTKAQLKWAE